MNGINEWLMNIQNIVDDIDRCIKSGKDEKLTLGRLSKSLGYSGYYDGISCIFISFCQDIPGTVPWL